MNKERPAERLYRSKSDKKIFGVCGGLSDYFRIDPVVFRLGFILLCLMGTLGIWLYLGMALVLPINPDIVENDEIKKMYRSKTDKKIFGVCGGVAAYFHVDPTVLRTIVLIASLFCGFGLLAYLLAAILLPVEE